MRIVTSTSIDSELISEVVVGEYESLISVVKPGGVLENDFRVRYWTIIDKIRVYNVKYSKPPIRLVEEAVFDPRDLGISNPVIYHRPFREIDYSKEFPITISGNAKGKSIYYAICDFGENKVSDCKVIELDLNNMEAKVRLDSLRDLMGGNWRDHLYVTNPVIAGDRLISIVYAYDGVVGATVGYSVYVLHGVGDTWEIEKLGEITTAYTYEQVPIHSILTTRDYLVAVVDSVFKYYVCDMWKLWYKGGELKKDLYNLGTWFSSGVFNGSKHVWLSTKREGVSEKSRLWYSTVGSGWKDLNYYEPNCVVSDDEGNMFKLSETPLITLHVATYYKRETREWRDIYMIGVKKEGADVFRTVVFDENYLLDCIKWSLLRNEDGSDTVFVNNYVAAYDSVVDDVSPSMLIPFYDFDRNEQRLGVLNIFEEKIKAILEIELIP